MTALNEVYATKWSFESFWAWKWNVLIWWNIGISGVFRDWTKKKTEQVWFKMVKIYRENVDGKPEMYQITLEISRYKTENPFIVNPWHLSVSIHILHTVLYTFPWVLTRRICLTIRSFFRWWSFPVFLCPSCAIRGWYCKEKLDAGHF